MTYERGLLKVIFINSNVTNYKSVEYFSFFLTIVTDATSRSFAF